MNGYFRPSEEKFDEESHSKLSTVHQAMWQVWGKSSHRKSGLDRVKVSKADHPEEKRHEIRHSSGCIRVWVHSDSRTNSTEWKVAFRFDINGDTEVFEFPYFHALLKGYAEWARGELKKRLKELDLQLLKRSNEIENRRRAITKFMETHEDA